MFFIPYTFAFDLHYIFVAVELAVQDVDLEEKVDVIISEWMGYMLLYEVYISMLFLFIAFQCSLTFIGSKFFCFFSCRVCCQASYLQEINGLNLGVLFFLLMLRYNQHSKNVTLLLQDVPHLFACTSHLLIFSLHRQK